MGNEWDTGSPRIWGPDFFSKNAQRWVAFSIKAIGFFLPWPEEQLVQLVSLPTPSAKGGRVPCTPVPILWAEAAPGIGLFSSGSPAAPTSASPRPLASPLLPFTPSVLRLPLCCPGLFLPGARRRPRARSRALVTTSRRAAPEVPAQPIGRPGAGAARGGAGKPISCSQSCTTTKGPGRAGGRRQGSDRSHAGARPAAATSVPARRAAPRRAAHVSVGHTGGRAAVGCPHSGCPTRPSPYRDVHGATENPRVTGNLLRYPETRPDPS